jgi:hypothetical protein
MQETELAAIEQARAREDVATLWAKTQSTDREIRKAAKRALYLLRSRGVAIGAPPPSIAPPGPATPSPAQEERVEDGHVSAPDASGEQLILIPRKESKGYRLFQAIVSETRGVTALDHMDASRRLLRTIVADLRSRGVDLRPVIRSRALAHLGRAVGLDPRQPPAVQAAREFPELASLDPRIDPEQSRASPEQAREALSLSARLFDEAPLRDYLPEREVLRETAARFDEIRVSPLYLNERQRYDQLMETMDRTIESYFDAARRARYAHRLRSLAEWFNAGGDDDKAELALAAAAQLDSGDAAVANPFARGLFERAFDLSPPLQGPEPKSPPPGSLIIPPR